MVQQDEGDARELAGSIVPDRATPSVNMPLDISPQESDHTTHFSIIEETGDIVSAFRSEPGDRNEIKPGKRSVRPS